MKSTSAAGELVVQPGPEGAPSRIHDRPRKRVGMNSGQPTRDRKMIPCGVVPGEGSHSIQLVTVVPTPLHKQGGIFMNN